MKHRSMFAFLSITVILLASAAGSAERVREFRGTGNTTTAEFVVEAPWILDWRVNSEYRKTMAFEIHLVDSLTGIHQGQILRTKRAGNGVRLFKESGRFKFRISSTLTDWHLKVEQLTPDEAELYTPRN